MRQQTFQKALSRLTDTGFRLFFVTGLVFAVLTGLYNIWLCMAELVILLVLYLYFQSGAIRRKQEAMDYLDHLASGVDNASRRTMLSSPMPIAIFRPDTDDIIWSNERFLHLTGDPDHLFETKLSALVPAFQCQWLLDGEHLSPEPVPVGEKLYLVYGNLVCTGEQDSFLATTYWVDVTQYATVAAKFDATRSVVGILQVDNYEDLSRGLEEGERAVMRSELNNRLSAWLDPSQGLLCRYDRDHYLLLVEAAQFQAFCRKKFSLLDEIRQVQSPNGVAATLSIGFGRNGETPRQLHEYASLALDMALSRGGDQVVVKDGNDFSFFGGRSKETERRTKVKSRVVANALSQLIRDSSQVLVMGHKNSDMDAIGAAAGMVCAARVKGRPVHIVVDRQHTMASDLIERLETQSEYKGVFISAEDAMIACDFNTLLIVVDVNRPGYVESAALLESINKIAVIDHHRRAADYIENAVVSLHEPYASSASELVSELLQYLVPTSGILTCEAEAMLAGIYLDTKGFATRTGVRTFEAAAYLRRAGAESSDVKRLFQSSFDQYMERQKLISSARDCGQGVIFAITGEEVDRIAAAQAADELLSIIGTHASVVAFRSGNDMAVSARAAGHVNVQLLMERLGGGGNHSAAGAQLKNTTPEEADKLITDAIRGYFDDQRTEKQDDNK